MVYSHVDFKFPEILLYSPIWLILEVRRQLLLFFFFTFVYCLIVRNYIEYYFIIVFIEVVHKTKRFEAFRNEEIINQQTFLVGFSPKIQQKCIFLFYNFFFTFSMTRAKKRRFILRPITRYIYTCNISKNYVL